MCERERDPALRHDRHPVSGSRGVGEQLCQLRLGVDTAAEGDSDRRVDHSGARRWRECRHRRLQPRARRYTGALPGLPEHQRCGRLPHPRYDAHDQRPAHHLVDGDRRRGADRRPWQPLLHRVEQRVGGHGSPIVRVLRPRSTSIHFPRTRRPSSAGAGGIWKRRTDCSTPARTGMTLIRSEEVNRVELQLPEGDYSGYLRTPAGFAPLPIGSRLDSSTNTFTWAPGVGFVGRYDFAFVRSMNGRALVAPRRPHRPLPEGPRRGRTAGRDRRATCRRGRAVSPSWSVDGLSISTPLPVRA